MGKTGTEWCEAYLDMIALNHQGRLGRIEGYNETANVVEFYGRDLNDLRWKSQLPIVLAETDRREVEALFEARHER